MQVYLSDVLKALKLYISEVENMEEKNNLHLAELISLLEESCNKPNPLGQNPSLSDLASLFDVANQEDTIETLKERLRNESSLLYEDKIKLTAAETSEMESQKKSRIAVGIFDELNKPFPWWNPLQGTFSDYGLLNMLQTKTAVDKRDFLLFTHIAFAINSRNRGQIENPLATPQARQATIQSNRLDTTLNRSILPSAGPTGQQTATVISKTGRKSRYRGIVCPTFFPGQSRFVLHVKSRKHEVITKVEIHIQQSPTLDSISPHAKLVKKIARRLQIDQCRSSPDNFYLLNIIQRPVDLNQVTYI